MKSMRKGQFTTFMLLGLMLSSVACGARSAASISTEPETPFKLASFEADGKVRAGLVLDGSVLDVQAANAHLIGQEGVAELAIPSTLRSIIERYATVAPRLYQIANYFGKASLDKLPFVYPLEEVSIKAPIKYPYNLLGIVSNYQDHAVEMARRFGNAQPAKVDPDAEDPSFFAKSPRSCIIDPGEAFLIPPGRNIDWEGELAVVIGRPAKNVTLETADDYVFGYSILFDVSDRGSGQWMARGSGGSRGPAGRPRGGGGFGVNWFRAKSRDGAAPFGPFIVPKEFVPHPDNLRLVTKVNGVIKQDGNTKDMIYDVAHQLRFLTSILTLYPGDVVSTGSSAGVGMARNPPEFLKPGDVVSIEIEGIGKLVTPMKSAPPSTN